LSTQTSQTREDASKVPAANAGSDTGLRVVRVDKIASATAKLSLSHDLEITTRCEALAGNVVVVRALNSTATYNTLELGTGRMANNQATS
jgi:hypothetical protein